MEYFTDRPIPLASSYPLFPVWLTDADKDTLYHRMTGLRAELDQLLGDDDPKWYAFGFARPADGDSPGPISTLNLAPGGSGIVIATWSHEFAANLWETDFF